MSYSNGLLSSPSSSTTSSPPGPPGVGFKLTDDGNFDIDGKQLTNVGDPIWDKDAATKRYIDIIKSDTVLRDGSQGMTGNLDLNDKKIINLADSTNDSDAVNMKQLKNHIGHNVSTSYHLKKSFDFYDDNDVKLNLSTNNIVGLKTDYKYGYYKIPKTSDQIIFSSCEFSIKNNLPRSTYSILFYMYGFRNNTLLSAWERSWTYIIWCYWCKM